METTEPVLAARPSHELRARPSTKRRYVPSIKATPTTLKGTTIKDAKTKKSPSATPNLDKKGMSPPKLTNKMARKGSTAGRPLVPLTERIAQDKAGSRGKREGESERPDIAPDGTSAGREGRQFTVANVGNNGRIYLRPSIRPAHQRYPQPTFTFPVTPPGTASVEVAGSDKPKLLAKTAEHHESQFTPTPRTSIVIGSSSLLPDPMKPTTAPQHRRAMSDSTIHEGTLSKGAGAEADGYRVVITKPAQIDEDRPRTMDHLNVAGSPILNIHIPSWRLGTPRFTSRGIPMIRGSSYAPTEDFRSSSVSMFDRSDRNLAVPPSGGGSKRPSRLVLPQTRFPRTSQASPRLPRPIRSTYVSTHAVIEPAMFNDLTFKPACDDRAIVRYSPTGSVTAATAPRLVAEITSPSFLDYELISDFFLTFRAFLEPESLLRMLVARLRWALERNDETGMVVRVRTFVALRHWILNYFVDDFVLDYGLRVTFCTLLNNFVDELSDDAKVRKVQLKILTELKKCWRRICAHYWDGPEFDDSLGAEVPIAPGGIARHRDPNLDPSHWEREGIEPPQWDNLFPFQSGAESTSSRAEAPKTTNISDFVVLGNRPGTPENQIMANPVRGNGPTSPLSIASMDIVSCSFPGKNMKPLNPNASHILAAHPIYSTSPILPSGAVATTPRALAGKRVRPTQTHKRNNSITDSLREHSSDKSSTHDVEFTMALQSAGSLVRGNLLPPGQPFVDVEPGFHMSEANRQTTVFQPDNRSVNKDKTFGGAMSGYGMKKLLGSVRRALSSRGQWSSGVQSSLQTISPVGPRGVTTNRLPGTAVVPQHGLRRIGARPPVRIDLLGAEVAEDFKKAVREEEAAAEAERLGFSIPLPNSAPAITGPIDYSAAHMESSTFGYMPHNQKPRPVSDMGITIGSKSIVIFDDTAPFGISDSQSRLPTTYSPSVEALADSFMPNGGDPTPPTTPPAHLVGGTPRRSSYLLNQHIEPSVEDNNETLPPFIPDLATLDGPHGSRASEDQSRPGFSATRHSQRYPPVSRGALRRHKRNQSSKTHQSIYSIRRHASFSSGMAPPSTVRSFDATTESSYLDNNSAMPTTEPPRMLRRRPGGDLRAAMNVEGQGDPVIRRSRSVGSLTTYSESIRSSYLLGPHADEEDHYSAPLAAEYSVDEQERFSVGQLTHKPVQRHLSLFSTHSSKPVMRPSFEIEAKRLAEIPDEDDGGIESALLKLEGKYRPRQRLSHPEDLGMFSTNIDEGEGTADPPVTAITTTNREDELDGFILHSHTRPISAADESRQSTFLDIPDTQTEDEAKATHEAISFLSEPSPRESYCSIPLLDRGLTDDGRSKRATTEWTNRSILRGSDDDEASYVAESYQLPVESSSLLAVEKTNSIQSIKASQTPPDQIEDPTFLDDASVAGSDLSSELSAVDGRSFDNVDQPAKLFPIHKQPPHPFGEPLSTPRSDSPTAPMTLAQALEMSPEIEQPSHQVYVKKPLPLTAEIFPSAPYISKPKALLNHPGTTEAPRTAPLQHAPHNHKFSVHLPFILAFDSDILAQQFTLIEKDALNDIDWKDLVDMDWKNATNNDSRSWVDFLRNTDAHGVEVVVARFNIMVKWAISEIVLTQHIEERARCIIKFIHIAAHCRRYRNFATLAQLTIALSSNEVARLTKTWEFVPSHDLKTLDDLEILVTPTRNFYNLRAEMESGSDSGCIPFVGIYTHDLLYNAQRASEIASSPTTPPLINFERCRIGAAVVKTLLRLLEASTRYAFQPIEGITERCLWMGALSDEEIRRHSESLEAPCPQ